MEEALNLRIEGCSTDDDFIETTSESIDKLIENLLLNHLVNDRQVHNHLVTVENRLELGLVYLLDDERNCNDDVRLDVGKCLHDDLRARYSGEEVDMGAHAHLEEELEHQAVHMRRWKH